MKQKTALITGICGMDGSLLADLLLEKDYNVFGIMRRNATHDLGNAKHLENDVDIIEGDITDMSSMFRIIQQVRPNELYNTAAMSVHPETYVNIHRIGPGKFTKPIKIEKLWNNIRIKNIKVEKERFLSEGGEIDIELINLKNNKNLFVLGFKNGKAQWFKIKQISRHLYKGKLIRLRQKCGEIIVTPNHSVYDENGKLQKPTINPNLLAVRKINYYNKCGETSVKLKTYNVGEKIVENDWICYKNESNKSVKSVLNITDGTLQAFLRFCGAFIAEGWTSYNVTNKTFKTSIDHTDRKWLEKLQNDLQLFYTGSSYIIENKKENCQSVWQLQISSQILYSIIRKYCGKKSTNKQIPDFFFLLVENLWPELLQTLHKEDESSNFCKNCTNIKYMSTSKKLIAQLCYIYTKLEIDFNYSFYKHDTKNGDDNFELVSIQNYQNNQEINDYEEINYEGFVYDISVDEVNNFCAGLGNIVVHNSHVHTSFEQPLATLDIDTKGVVNILEVVRNLGFTTRIFHCSTSEMFGSADPPQTIETMFIPCSPYAIAKVASHNFIRLYREAYNVYCCAGITFNHEGPRRGANFVTRKITMGVAQSLKNPSFKLKLGNLDAKRDWGFAKDYCQGFWLALQQTKPDDYIFATNEMHSVKEFCELAFSYVNLNWQEHVEFDRFLMRPSEVDALQGDYSLTESKIGWKPTIKFEELVKIMVEHDCKLLGIDIK
ncbi:MAG: GDP-mannose 4,6-dehydratase [Patescibacteria group bacterium]|jgi:GDP-mannose 4,6-dehydratase